MATANSIRDAQGVPENMIAPSLKFVADALDRAAQAEGVA